MDFRTEKMKKVAVSISPVYKGLVTLSDLLRPTGSHTLHSDRDSIRRDGHLFEVRAEDFFFSFWFIDGKLVFQRCADKVVLSPNPIANKVTIGIAWSPTTLTVHCISGKPPKAEAETEKISTLPTFPPVSLIRFARHNKFLPSSTFPTVEALRQAVYEALSNLQDDIKHLGAFNPFWDQSYDGRKKGEPTPKKEMDIHPTIHLHLFEWALMRSVEIIPENRTGVGNLDFSFVGYVEGEGPVSICVEFKMAHARDLAHGLETQLPAYMQRKRSNYGAYVVMWFKGKWFDKPTATTIRRLVRESGLNADNYTESEIGTLETLLIMRCLGNPILRDIRVFVIDVSKPTSASIRPS